MEVVCEGRLLAPDRVVCKDELELGVDMALLDSVPMDTDVAVAVCAVVLVEACVVLVIELESLVMVRLEEGERLGGKFPPEVVCDCVKNDDPEVTPDVTLIALETAVLELAVEVVGEVDLIAPELCCEEVLVPALE